MIFVYGAMALLLCVCAAQFIIILKMRGKIEAAAAESEKTLRTVEETISKAEETAEQKERLLKARQSLQSAIELLPEAIRATQELIAKKEERNAEPAAEPNDKKETEVIAESAAPPEPPKPPAPFENVKVLVCEDYEQHREIMGGMFEEFGIQPEFASNGVECVDILNSGKMFDMIFMDLQMPVMNGYEAARSIRLNSKFDSIPIISMTANAMREIVNKCFETGMNDHIAKPVEFDRLEYVLAKWLPEKQTDVNIKA